MTRVELTNRVTALHEKLKLFRNELFEEDTDESIDAAEKCHEALIQLATQMALAGISFSDGLGNSDSGGFKSDTLTATAGLILEGSCNAWVSSGHTCVIPGMFRDQQFATKESVNSPVMVKFVTSNNVSARIRFQTECNYLKHLNRDGPGEFVKVYAVINSRDTTPLMQLEWIRNFS